MSMSLAMESGGGGGAIDMLPVAETPIWQRAWQLEELAALTQGTLVAHLGIEFVEILPRALRARMAVRAHTAQRLGYLHGGASLAMAETVGSLASQMCIDRDAFASLGLDINANHVRAVPIGEAVFATARPLHLGRQTHVWDVRIETAQQKLVCIARLTTTLVARTGKA